jgi:hypothetical protein
MIEMVFSEDRRAVCIYQGLPDMGPERREAWTTWLDRHGLDADMVVLGTEIRCDDEERRVYYTAYDREAVDLGRNSIGRVDRYVQLEAPALPFPS